MVAVLFVSTVLAACLVYLDYNPLATRNATLVEDPIPPDEFIIGENKRVPATYEISAAMNTRPFTHLSENERRTIFRAVIYFCNEDLNDWACGRYVNYCGETCRILVRRR